MQASRPVQHVLLVLVMLTLPVEAAARTAPVRGAASKPRGLAIQAPFPCGVTFRVNCGYGCSKAHSRVRHVNSTNDYYALDMTRLEPRGGFDKAVVAVAGGIVRYAGWARGGWSPYGRIVYLEHPYKDRFGKRYQSIYAHLNRVKVRAGQKVKAGTVVGTMGGSSRKRHLRFGAHLHFAMYRGAKPTLGGGTAAVPEPMGRYEDLRRGTVMKACGRPEQEVVWRDLFDGAVDDTAVGGLE